MKFIFICVYMYFLDKIWWYYGIKYFCKKHNANCDECSNFQCPRFSILHKEEDEKFLNDIKMKIKKFFNRE